MSRTMGRIVNKAVALFTNVRDRQRGRPLRQRNNNLLINVLDAGATSPCENSSTAIDEFNTPDPTRAEAFVSEKSVPHIAAR